MFMDADDIKERIKRNDAKAQEIIERVVGSPKLPVFEEYRVAISRYVRYRDLLDPLDESESNLDALAYLSVSKIVKETNGDLSIAGVSGSCNGMGSPEEKKFLTFIVLQSKLGVKLDPEEATRIETIDDLALQTYRLLLEKQN